MLMRFGVLRKQLSELIKALALFLQHRLGREYLLIKKYTCQNGVRILVEQIPTVRSAAIGVWVKQGHEMKS